ncbi:Nudix hydrolase domain-containing protein [Meloidogyne graminicola]|uniref:Bis(5'-nucleosyl)-tetraphosphatase [asymmetrical] n=1 Tax=Meloidogyne graminicola TaxID=189291 RepID=A0A8S9ZLK9_9BILA|nr:Nudix hydrolase domain-containing protein [Meloidogyne graminicola]
MNSVEPSVRAAGFLIYRKKTTFVEYLLLQASYSPFHWTPPKGHVDPGEDEWQAAIREVKEESGIDVNQNLTLIKDFKHEMFYHVNSKLKKVTYWLAKSNDANLAVELSHEHKDFRWVSLSDALELAQHEEMKKLLREADVYIDKNVGVFY